MSITFLQAQSEPCCVHHLQKCISAMHVLTKLHTTDDVGAKPGSKCNKSSVFPVRTCGKAVCGTHLYIPLLSKGLLLKMFERTPPGSATQDVSPCRPRRRCEARHAHKYMFRCMQHKV